MQPVSRRHCRVLILSSPFSSEKGTVNLQRNDLEIHTVCFEDCDHYKSRNLNSKYYHFTYFDGTFDSNEKYNQPNEYVELEDERQDFDELLNNNVNYNRGDNVDDINKDAFLNENTGYNVPSHVEKVLTTEFGVQTNYNHDIETEGTFLSKSICHENLEDPQHRFVATASDIQDVEHTKAQETNCARDFGLDELEEKYDDAYEAGGNSSASDDEEIDHRGV